MVRLGKHDVLIDHYFRGRPVMAIREEKSVYQRADGSFFTHDNRRHRITITRQSSGAFYFRSDYNP